MEERDHYLEQTLKGEAEGILAWAVEGARLWYESGLEDPQLVINATAEYKNNADALSEFIGSAVTEVEGANTPAADLYKAYKVWAYRNDLMVKDTWGRNTFYQSMDERGFKRMKIKGALVFPALEVDPDIRREFM